MPNNYKYHKGQFYFYDKKDKVVKVADQAKVQACFKEAAECPMEIVLQFLAEFASDGGKDA